jgi:hypothetical protein
MTLELVRAWEDDYCDVCLVARYPGPTPQDGRAPLAPGWVTCIHPFSCMAVPAEPAVSLCCPACAQRVREALRIPDEQGRFAPPPTEAR